MIWTSSGSQVHPRPRVELIWSIAKYAWRRLLKPLQKVPDFICHVLSFQELDQKKNMKYCFHTLAGATKSFFPVLMVFKSVHANLLVGNYFQSYNHVQTSYISKFHQFRTFRLGPAMYKGLNHLRFLCIPLVMKKFQSGIYFPRKSTLWNRHWSGCFPDHYVLNFNQPL